MPTSYATLVFGSTVAVALATLSCRQVVGIGDGPPEALTTTACGLPFGTNDCASCASANCCSAASTCSSNAGCVTYESCLGACKGDPACRSQCTIDDYLVTASDGVSALSACLASKCEHACRLTCGGVEGYITQPQFANGCQSCIEGLNAGRACDDARAWASSPDGDAYWRCHMSCSTPDCWVACAQANPKGAALFNTFLQDYQGCAACQFGGYWACVGRVSWPHANPDYVDGGLAWTTFTFSVLDPTGSPPPIPPDVSICTGCPCTTPGAQIWWQGTADSNGVVSGRESYPLDTAGFGLNGCAEITSSPSSGRVPTFCYWGYPLSGGPTGSTSQVCNFAKSMDLEALIAADGHKSDPTRFSFAVAATVFDCLGNPAPNVAIVLQPATDSDAIRFYGKTAGAGTLTATDPTGVGGFLNVYVGPNADAAIPVTIAAMPMVDGGPGQVASSVSVAIQPGTVTEALMYPTPPTPR